MGSTGRATTTAAVNEYIGLKTYTVKTAENEVTITQNYDRTYTAFDNNGRPVNGGTFRYLNEAKAAAKSHLTGQSPDKIKVLKRIENSLPDSAVVTVKGSGDAQTVEIDIERLSDRRNGRYGRLRTRLKSLGFNEVYDGYWVL